MYIITLEGNKKQMEQCKKALLETNGSFNVNIENLTINKIGLFKHELKVELDGTKENIIKFNNRTNTNYKILNGDILGLLDYL